MSKLIAPQAKKGKSSQFKPKNKYSALNDDNISIANFLMSKNYGTDWILSK